MLVEHMSVEDRTKFDATLDGADPETGADRRAAFERAGVSAEQADRTMRLRAAATPEERAALKVQMAKEAAERRRKTRDDG